MKKLGLIFLTMKKPKEIGTVQPIYKVWMSKSEAMKYLGCSGKYLEKLRRERLVSFSQFGKMIWYNVASLKSLVDRHIALKERDVVKEE